MRAESRGGDHVDELLVERLAVEHPLTQRGYLRQQPGGWCQANSESVSARYPWRGTRIQYAGSVSLP
jgi:hypothetical protein